MVSVDSLKQLWSRCFADDDSFIRLFFEQVYRPEYTRADVEGDRVCSALYWLPRTLTYQGKRLPVAYLYGVATAPECRGEGRSSRLLAAAAEVMRQQGFAGIVTVPANAGLFGFYERSGFYTAFYRSRQMVVRQPDSAGLVCSGTILLRSVSGSCLPMIDCEQQPEASQLYPFFAEQMGRRDACIQHDLPAFQVVLTDLQQSGGQLWVARDEQGVCEGQLFLYPTESGTWLAKELLAVSDEVANALLQTAMKRLDVERLTCIVPPDHFEGEPYGMACSLDPLRFPQQLHGFMSLMLD